jgi:hypothetical protein
LGVWGILVWFLGVKSPFSFCLSEEWGPRKVLRFWHITLYLRNDEHLKETSKPYSIQLSIKGSPIKRPCQEEILPHGKKIMSFLQGRTIASSEADVLSFSCSLIFFCFRVAAFLNPRQSPIRIKVELTPYFHTGQRRFRFS